MVGRNANTDRDVEERNTSLGKLMQPNGAPTPPQAMSAPAGTVAGMSLGGQMTPQPQAEPPVAPGTPEFQQRVERNKSFLQNPEIQAGLMQMGLNLMAGGDFGSSLGGGLEAAGRVTLGQEADTEAARKAAIDERQMQVSEGNLAINEEELRIKKGGAKSAEDALIRRNALFKRAGANGAGLQSMKEVDLLDLAGELTAAGDDDGAKIAIDMANSKRLGSSTNDLVEFNAAKAAGDPDAQGFFSDWQRSQRKAAVAQPATAGISDTMQKAGTESMQKADDMALGLDDYKLLVDVVAGADTGKLTPVTLPIRQIFNQLGIPISAEDGDQVHLLELLRAEQNKLALKLRSPAQGMGLPGAASDQDLIFLKEAGPGLSTSPEANMAMATIMYARARRQADIERMKADYIFDKGTLTGWSKERDNYVKNSTMFTAEEQQLLNKITGIESKPPGTEDTGTPKNAEKVPSAPPDNLSEADKTAWPHLTPDERLELIAP